MAEATVRWLNDFAWDWGFLIPNFGNFGGPGWANGHRLADGEPVDENIEVATNKFNQPSQVDQACKDHDIAYQNAEKPENQPYEYQLKLEADRQLLREIAALDFSTLDNQEMLYAGMVAVAFAVKIELEDRPLAGLEAIQNEARALRDAILMEMV